ncbi:MAG: type III pantothenate kinase [Gemmatimonadetes bacterium]|nr:type III pantothenate kinase [Gemmatimonadota bacterium]
MSLVLDIGNTETVAGLFRGAELLAHWRLASDPRRTSDELGLLLRRFLTEDGFDPASVRTITFGSVVPSLSGVLREACERYLHASAVSIDARTPLPIRLEVDEPLTVGADRIVNTLAASRAYRADSIVVDLGTATTYDCVTADGVFLGGVIAPGVRSAAERLTERTAKLPRVELAQPPAVIGKRTEACLQSGIFYGAVDAVDGMVSRIRAEWNRPDALVVATGGLAALIGPHCRTVRVIEPFLTLQGLRLAREHLDRREAISVDPGQLPQRSP